MIIIYNNMFPSVYKKVGEDATLGTYIRGIRNWTRTFPTTLLLNEG